MPIGTLAPRRRLQFVAPLVLLFLAVFLLLDARAARAQDIWHVDDSVNDGLVSLWRFDDVTAVPTMYDLVGGSHGTAIAATVSLTNNVPALNYLNGGVLDLRSTLDFVQVPNSAALNTSDEFTLAVWVYRGNSANEQTIFDAGTGTNNWLFYIDTGNHLAFGPQDMGNALTTATIPLAQWTHVAVVVSSDSPNVHLYINGVSSGPINLGPISSPSGFKYIGATSAQGAPPLFLTFQTDFFVGLMDEMHFYDRPLSAAEVALLADGELCVTDGEAWNTAFRFLECIEPASANGDQAWIGEGRYLTTASRLTPLFLEHSVNWYGGFLGLSNGGGETAISQRPLFDPDSPLTVITGDILGNDLPLDATPDPFANHTENMRVLLFGDDFEDHLLDGFALRGGYADGGLALNNSGSALHEEGISLVLRNMVFSQNHANASGGALYSNPAMSGENLTFIGNNADVSGGAMSAENTLILTSTLFLSNTSFLQGGALRLTDPATLTGVRFEGNSANANNSDGGALSIASGGPTTVTIRNSTFFNNRANISGAMVSDGVAGSPNTLFLHIENSLFANNSAIGNLASPTALDGDDARLFDTNVTLLHNTFFGPSGTGPSITLVRSAGDLRYNIFNSQQVALHAFDNSTVNEDYNLLVESAFTQSNNGVVNFGGNSFSGVPGFVNAAGGDYHISLASEARDAADTSSTPLDFEGDARPGGLAPDIGYDEIPLTLPNANGGGPHTVNEGTSLALDGATSSDADNAIVSYSWDCTNNGSLDQIGSSPTGNACPYADNGTFTLRLLVEDASGYKDEHLSSVTVNNVAPTYTPATAQSATAGQSKAFTLGSFTDPGPDAPWEILVNWGDGSADSIFNAGAVGAIAPQNRTFTTAATRIVTVTIRDKDGGAQSKTFQVTVTGSGNPVTPTPLTPTPVTPTPGTPTPVPGVTPVVYLPAISGK